MARTVSIGVQDFSKIIVNNYFYIDKTAFIQEWWENGDDVTLITRPRRFGKTLTMSMLEYFFSVDFAGRSDLFQELDIWKEEKLFSKSKICENFYHGFILGLIAELRNQYVITSNRESGFARYDVMLKSKKDNGISFILEFKVLDSDKEKSLQDTVRTALRQIIDKEYAALLNAEGIKTEQICIYGFAFNGKSILIDGGCILDYDGK